MATSKSKYLYEAHWRRTSIATATITQLRATLEPAVKLLARLGRLKKPGAFLIDISAATEIDPGAILILLYLRKMLYRHGCAVWLQAQGKPRQLLLEHVQHYLRPRAARTAATDKADYLARGIYKREDMVAELSEWGSLLTQFVPVAEEDVALWQMQIGEVVANAFQHARIHGPDEAAPPSPEAPRRLDLAPRIEREVLIAGKTFMSQQVVQLAALDLGAGIPEVIGRAALEAGIGPCADGKLIEYACREGVTSRCVPENQGAGLPSLIRTLTTPPRGSLLICSGNGLYYSDSDGSTVRELEPPQPVKSVLAGTLVVITIHANDEAPR